MLGDHAIAERLQQPIYEVSKGNVFCATECVRLLIEQGTLKNERRNLAVGR